MIQDCKVARVLSSKQSGSADQGEMHFMILALGFLLWESEKESGCQGHGTGSWVLIDKLGLCKPSLLSQSTSGFSLTCINFCIGINL